MPVGVARPSGDQLRDMAAQLRSNPGMASGIFDMSPEQMEAMVWHNTSTCLRTLSLWWTTSCPVHSLVLLQCKHWTVQQQADGSETSVAA